MEPVDRSQGKKKKQRGTNTMSVASILTPRAMSERSPKLGRLHLKQVRDAWTNKQGAKRGKPITQGFLKCDDRPADLLFEGELTYHGLLATDKAAFGEKGLTFRIAIGLHNEKDLEELHTLAGKVLRVPEDADEWKLNTGNLYGGSVYMKAPMTPDGSRVGFDTPFDLDPTDHDKNAEQLLAGMDVRAVVETTAWYNFETKTCGLSFKLKSLKPFKTKTKKKKETLRAIPEEEEDVSL